MTGLASEDRQFPVRHTKELNLAGWYADQAHRPESFALAFAHQPVARPARATAMRGMPIGHDDNANLDTAPA